MQRTRCIRRCCSTSLSLSLIFNHCGKRRTSTISCQPEKERRGKRNCLFNFHDFETNYYNFVLALILSLACSTNLQWQLKRSFLVSLCIAVQMNFRPKSSPLEICSFLLYFGENHEKKETKMILRIYLFKYNYYLLDHSYCHLVISSVIIYIIHLMPDLSSFKIS